MMTRKFIVAQGQGQSCRSRNCRASLTLLSHEGFAGFVTRYSNIFGVRITRDIFRTCAHCDKSNCGSRLKTRNSSNELLYAGDRANAELQDDVGVGCVVTGAHHD